MCSGLDALYIDLGCLFGAGGEEAQVTMEVPILGVEL